MRDIDYRYCTSNGAGKYEMATHVFEEAVKFWMTARIVGHFKERCKEVIYDVLKALHLITCLVDVTVKYPQQYLL